MNRMQAQVADFHEATGSTIGEMPAIRDAELRAKLIMEEAVETVAALGYTVVADVYRVEPDADGTLPKMMTFEKSYDEPNLEEAIDGICDLIYVAMGTGVAMGIDVEEHYDEVHRANMAKLGGPKRADGKQLKPKDWTPPDHQKIMRRQEARVAEWNKLEATIRGSKP